MQLWSETIYSLRCLKLLLKASVQMYQIWTALTEKTLKLRSLFLEYFSFPLVNSLTGGANYCSVPPWDHLRVIVLPFTAFCITQKAQATELNFSFHHKEKHKRSNSAPSRSFQVPLKKFQFCVCSLHPFHRQRSCQRTWIKHQRV